MNSTTTTTAHGNNDDDDIVGAMTWLTDRQERLIRLLPIVPTILSTIASGTIIYLVLASGFRTSAYKRILLGLSVYDIFNALLVTIGPFMIPPAPKQNPNAIWTFGNDTTCNVLGTLRQVSVSMLLYNAMLSYYYLLTIRFGVRESVFARRYEPYMHTVAILFPIVAAITGATLNLYDKTEFLGPSCWIVEYPPGCDEDKGECIHPILRFIFAEFWILFTLLSIVVNNLVIYCYVKRRVYRGRRSSMTAESQAKRLREVATQAFLYVASFLGTCIWTLILLYLEQMNSSVTNEMKIFPLVVLQGIFVSSTGIFNLCIYLRPRYLKTRQQYPLETRRWAVRRALYGEAVPTTSSTELNVAPSSPVPSSQFVLGMSPKKSMRKLPNLGGGPPPIPTQLVDDLPESHPSSHRDIPPGIPNLDHNAESLSMGDENDRRQPGEEYIDLEEDESSGEDDMNSTSANGVERRGMYYVVALTLRD